MTADDWNGLDKPDDLLAIARKHQLLTLRKARLVACGCYRLLWNQTSSAEVKAAVEMAEARADGTVTQTELDRHAFARHLAPPDTLDFALQGSLRYLTAIRVNATHIAQQLRLAAQINRTHLDPVHPAQAEIIRDIFGNPFRPVAFDHSWRSESAVALARTAYDTRNFTLLPILADALEEAGCDHPDILSHCRQPGATHVRGCWVVDGVLGKS